MYGGEFCVVEDDLVDYNDIKDEQSSNTPVQTPPKLDSESEGEDLVKREKEAKSDVAQKDLEEGLKAVEAAELARVTKNIQEQEERKAKRIQEFETLSLRLSENGYKMRMKVWADPNQAFRPMSMTAPTNTLADILQTIPSEDAEQISEFQGLD